MTFNMKYMIEFGKTLQSHTFHVLVAVYHSILSLLSLFLTSFILIFSSSSKIAYLFVIMDHKLQLTVVVVYDGKTTTWS